MLTAACAWQAFHSSYCSDTSALLGRVVDHNDDDQVLVWSDARLAQSLRLQTPATSRLLSASCCQHPATASSNQQSCSCTVPAVADQAPVLTPALHPRSEARARSWEMALTPPAACGSRPMPVTTLSAAPCTGMPAEADAACPQKSDRSAALSWLEAVQSSLYVSSSSRVSAGRGKSPRERITATVDCAKPNGRFRLAPSSGSPTIRPAYIADALPAGASLACMLLVCCVSPN